MTLLICFAGQIGSGKTSVSNAVASHFGWGRVGFSDFLRAQLARSGADPASREALQNLGQSLVDTDARSFCRSVLAMGGFQSGTSFVVDGIRHVPVQRILEQLAKPSATKLIYLSVDQAKRLERVTGRDSGQGDFSRAESHRVEAELQVDLPSIADLMVDATHTFDKVVAECVGTIKGWLNAP